MTNKNTSSAVRAPKRSARFRHLFSLLTAFCILFSLALVVNGRVLGHKTASTPEPADDAVVTHLADGAVVINTTTLGADVEGYAGAVPLEVTFKDGKITQVIALENEETPSFFDDAFSILSKAITGMNASDSQQCEIDAVSGATYSSDAIIENVRRAVKYYLENVAGATSSESEIGNNSGLSIAWWAALLVGVMATIIPFFIKNKIYRTIQLLLNVSVLGFWTGTFLSYTGMISVLSNPLRLAMLPIMLLMAVAFIVPIFNGGNHYCTWICPFGSLQQLAGMTVKHKPKISATAIKALTWMRRLIWSALMLLTWSGVLTQWLDYEIFTAFMVSSAPLWMLILASTFIILSFIVERPFCRFVCPVGSIINISKIKD